MKPFNKIFCLGFGKSGTWSVHQALLNLGINSTHDDKIVRKLINKHNKEELKQFISKYQAINTRDFKGFEDMFPNSLYIFTYRNPHDLAYSMAKHCYNRPNEAKNDPLASDCNTLFTAQWTNYQSNVRMVEEYYTDVFTTLFQYKDRFLFLDIFKDSSVAYKNLCAFLDVQYIEGTDFPHLNKNIY